MSSMPQWSRKEIATVKKFISKYKKAKLGKERSDVLSEVASLIPRRTEMAVLLKIQRLIRIDKVKAGTAKTRKRVKSSPKLSVVKTTVDHGQTSKKKKPKRDGKSITFDISHFEIDLLRKKLTVYY